MTARRLPNVGRRQPRYSWAKALSGFVGGFCDLDARYAPEIQKFRTRRDVHVRE